MSAHGVPNHLSDQPGLEVNYQPGLEVDHRPAAANESDGLQAVSYRDEPKYSPAHDAVTPSTQGTYYNGHYTTSPGIQTAALSNYDGQVHKGESLAEEGQRAPTKRNKRWTILGVTVAIVVIFGAVLGGVLGSRATRSSSTDLPSNSTTNSTTLNNIRSASRLAVTGWRDGSNYRVRLFYQGQDQKLRMSTYASNETTWSEPVTLTGLEYAANDNTALAASTTVENDITQVKVFYIDQDSVLRGQGFQDYKGEAEQGTRLVINDWPITVPSTSRLASYWPFIVSQDSNGAFRWIRYLGPGASDWWTNSTLSVIGSSSAGMVVLPASAWYHDMGGFAYRRSDGKMRTYLTDTSNNVTGTAWGSSSDLSQSIPEDTTVGGFAVARPNDANNQTNTYLLYQDGSGSIQVVWQDDTSGWKGPSTYDAFDNADNGTDIACITPAAWDNVGVEVTSNQNMNKCYFQVGNRVREVYYDGSNWNNQGYLPIT